MWQSWLAGPRTFLLTRIVIGAPVVAFASWEALPAPYGLLGAGAAVGVAGACWVVGVRRMRRSVARGDTPQGPSQWCPDLDGFDVDEIS